MKIRGRKIIVLPGTTGLIHRSRETIGPTMLQGSARDNVLPTSDLLRNTTAR
jgi:hypothetical protein